MASQATKLKKALESISKKEGQPDSAEKAPHQTASTEIPKPKTSVKAKPGKAQLEVAPAESAGTKQNASQKPPLSETKFAPETKGVPSETKFAPETKAAGKTLHTQTAQNKKNVMSMVAARKAQMISKSGADPKAFSSPMQIHLVQSESLRIAQDKITEMEEDLNNLRKKNESLVSASEILKEKNDLLNSKLEDLRQMVQEEKSSFNDEKKILLSALDEAKEQIAGLKDKKQELEKRLSRDLYGIRNRENSLESRLEILKMENSVLQREKDKKIIELGKQIQKMKRDLSEVHNKNQELQAWNNRLQEYSRRTVSTLRATIYNLEGVKSMEKTLFTEAGKDIKEKTGKKK